MIVMIKSIVAYLNTVTCMHVTITILTVHTQLVFFNKIYKSIKEDIYAVHIYYSKIYDILHTTYLPEY